MHQTSIIAGAAAILAIAATAPLHGQARPGGGRMAPPTPNANAANLVPLDNWQPKKLPALPSGITLKLIQEGDSVFHGKGGCVTCHGADAFGMPNSGSALTLGLNHIPINPRSIDSLVTAGMPEWLTRSGVAMPAKGASSNLTPEEIQQVAAYVWAIASTSDEPWPGGHKTHGGPTAGNPPAKNP